MSDSNPRRKLAAILAADVVGCSRLMGMDVITTLKTWTVQQSLQSVIAFALTVLIYVIF